MAKEVSNERKALDLLFMLQNLHQLRRDGGIELNDYIPIKKKVVAKIEELVE